MKANALNTGLVKGLLGVRNGIDSILSKLDATEINCNSTNTPAGNGPENPVLKVSAHYKALDLFDLFLSRTSKQKQWKRSTISKFEALRNHLFRFNNQLYLDELTWEDFDDFVNYLRISKLSETSVQIYLDRFRKFLRWAYDNSYTTNSLFKFYTSAVRL